MSALLTFNPVTEWVDYTDPANVPPSVRVISAADLLRYENALTALVQRSNEHETTLAGVGTDIDSLDGRATAVETAVTTNATTLSTLTGTVNGLSQQIAALTKTTVVRSLTTAYTVSTSNRIHIHTGAAATYTLPTATGNTGIEFVFHNRGTGTLTISSSSTQLWANGGAFGTKPILANETVWMVSDGTNWVILLTDSNATT